MRKIILYFFLLINTAAFTQNWVNAGLPPNFINPVYIDSINDKMYVGGIGWLTTSGGAGIGIYDGATRTWDIRDTFNYSPGCIIMYGGELYVAGGFKYVDSIYTSSIAKWNGTTWINIADTVFGDIYNMKVYNNELYVMGEFNKIGGITVNSLAKWNGTTWSDVYNFPNWSQGGCFISDIIFYNGDLYVGGGFTIANGNTNITMYKNNTWQKVGTNDTLRGLWCGITSLEVYNNELYAGGTMWHTEGNVGHGIQKWNGTSWSAAGTGVQDVNNITNNGSVQINKLHAHKGKLYACGNFTYAGNVIAPRIASWDGNTWCAIDRNIDQNIRNFCFYKDSLYIVSVDTMEHICINDFAKFTGDYTHADTCSINFNGIERFSNNNALLIYPNPATKSISVNFENVSDYQNSTVTIQNTLGQPVKKFPFTESIDVSGLAEGCYFLQVILPNGETYKTKFIKQ